MTGTRAAAVTAIMMTAAAAPSETAPGVQEDG
jgi:hypothetical protein